MNGLLKERVKSAIKEDFTAEESELIAFYGRHIRKARGAGKKENDKMCFTVMRKKSETGFLPPEKTAALKRKISAAASERFCVSERLGSNEYLAFNERLAANETFFGDESEYGFAENEKKVFDDNIGGGSFFGNAKRVLGANMPSAERDFGQGFSTESELWARERFYRAILSACNPL